MAWSKESSSCPASLDGVSCALCNDLLVEGQGIRDNYFFEPDGSLDCIELAHTKCVLKKQAEEKSRAKEFVDCGCEPLGSCPTCQGWMKDNFQAPVRTTAIWNEIDEYNSNRCDEDEMKWDAIDGVAECVKKAHVCTEFVEAHCTECGAEYNSENKCWCGCSGTYPCS